MSEYFSGITFPQQKVTPSDDASIRRSILADGILSGCEISYIGSTLTFGAGLLIGCGRQFRHTTVQNFAVTGATSGFARLVVTIDTTKASTKYNFDQIDAAIEYAAVLDGFTQLRQDDINESGTVYQMQICVIALSSGGISGIASILRRIERPWRIEDGGTGATDPKTARENLEVAQAIESTEHPGCYYRMVDGEKEWLNPPCLFGVDYRTADRNNGNPVYTKVINLGVLSADKDVNPNLPAENYRVFDMTIYVDGRVNPTGWTGDSWDFTAYYSDSAIKIRSGSSFYDVKYNGYAQIWFCKGIG